MLYDRNIHARSALDALNEVARLGHEEVHIVRDDAADYRAIVAIHSTVLGPALGGTRLCAYASDADALFDALRLARGMTYKCAAAGLPLGGGKAVVMAPPEPFDRRALLRAHGRAVDKLAGRYITSVDIGTTPDDMSVIAGTTRYVTGMPDEAGDPSPTTARGVLRAIQGALRFVTGSEDLFGRTIAIQGCGNVGRHLAAHLARAGAKLFVSDLDPERTAALAAVLGAHVVAPDDILHVPADVFAPCARGAGLNDETIPRLRSGIVAGGANNQLLHERHGAMLAEHGIVYVPDYIANAGGATFLCGPLAGWSAQQIDGHVEGFAEQVFDLLSRARRDGILPHEAAARAAEARLDTARERSSENHDDKYSLLRKRK